MYRIHYSVLILISSKLSVQGEYMFGVDVALANEWFATTYIINV